MMLKESAIAVNNAGGGNVSGIIPDGIPPAETALGRMRRCAEKHKKRKKKHVKESSLTGTLADVALGVLGAGGGKKPTSVPSFADKKKKMSAKADRIVHSYKTRLADKPSTQAGSSDAEKQAYADARNDPTSRVARDRDINRAKLQQTRARQTAIAGNNLQNNQTGEFSLTPQSYGPSVAKKANTKEKRGTVYVTRINGKLHRSHKPTE